MKVIERWTGVDPYLYPEFFVAEDDGLVIDGPYMRREAAEEAMQELVLK